MMISPLVPTYLSLTYIAKAKAGDLKEETDSEHFKCCLVRSNTCGPGHVTCSQLSPSTGMFDPGSA